MGYVIGGWFALAGVVAGLAGLAGLRRSSRLRRSGISVWGMVVASPFSAGERLEGSLRRTLIQYTLRDGRVLERVCPRKTGSGQLAPGERVLVWYDPDDPRDVLVFGREGRRSDRAFLAVGLVFVALGATIASVVR